MDPLCRPAAGLDKALAKPAARAALTGSWLIATS